MSSPRGIVPKVGNFVGAASPSLRPLSPPVDPLPAIFHPVILGSEPLSLPPVISDKESGFVANGEIDASPIETKAQKLKRLMAKKKFFATSPTSSAVAASNNDAGMPPTQPSDLGLQPSFVTPDASVVATAEAQSPSSELPLVVEAVNSPMAAVSIASTAELTVVTMTPDDSDIAGKSDAPEPESTGQRLRRLMNARRKPTPVSPSSISITVPNDPASPAAVASSASPTLSSPLLQPPNARSPVNATVALDIRDARLTPPPSSAIDVGSGNTEVDSNKARMRRMLAEARAKRELEEAQAAVASISELPPASADDLPPTLSAVEVAQGNVALALASSLTPTAASLPQIVTAEPEDQLENLRLPHDSDSTTVVASSLETDLNPTEGTDGNLGFEVKESTTARLTRMVAEKKRLAEQALANMYQHGTTTPEQPALDTSITMVMPAMAGDQLAVASPAAAAGESPGDVLARRLQRLQMARKRV